MPTSSTPYLLAIWLVCAAVMVVTYVKYGALNKKYGSKQVPGGHPYGCIAVILQISYQLANLLKIPLDTLFSALTGLATIAWLAFAIRDALKSKSALDAAPAPITHEGIPSWGLALKGLNHIYIDLSGIDTKTLVDSKIEIDSLKARIADKLHAEGIEIASTKANAKSWLTVQMKTQPGPRQTGSITTLYLQIAETVTNDRLDSIHVRVSAPIFSTVTVAVCDGIPSAEALAVTFDERLEQFISERNS